VKSRLIRANDVYDIVAQIPEGKVTTYGDIARALGHPGASRAIGRILNRNPNPIITPCHRVIKSDGKLGGYVYGTIKKKELLKKEGLCFIRDRAAGFANYRISIPNVISRTSPLLQAHAGVQAT
jgi:methylated-DNA-[protein]-cysteine S-methyltransferase